MDQTENSAPGFRIKSIAVAVYPKRIFEKTFFKQKVSLQLGFQIGDPVSRVSE